MSESKTPLCDADVRIVYHEFSKLPKGIRDKSGYLFFFREIHRYQDQAERYEQECTQLQQLAEHLLAALTKESELRARVAEEIHIIFDGPPSHESGRFVEVENAAGKSINAGRWEQRGDYWHLILNRRL